MRLSEFIRAHSNQIVEEWEAFAKRLNPPAEGLSPLALRNHIVEILRFIVADIDTPQTGEEQIRKSRGEKIKASGDSAAEVHASLRHAGGFNLDQMVSEYRALRACVTKLWRAHLAVEGGTNLDDLVRFDEAIDQELTESISFYSRASEQSRELFLGILGHDLRNPLGAVLMSAELSLNIGGAGERQIMLASQIVASANRMTEIIETLLDLTRARLGSGFPIIRSPMDMAYVGRLLVGEMRSMHPERLFTLDMSGPTEGEWDKPRIGQVFSNLLGNAVQHGFQDSPIEVRITGDPYEVVISVQNRGIPIPPHKRGAIFKSLHRPGKQDGSGGRIPTSLGLGLYITKEIVSAHGGSISVCSDQDATTFAVRLPRVKGEA